MYCSKCGSLMDGVVCGRCGNIQAGQMMYQQETRNFFSGAYEYFAQYKEKYNRFDALERSIKSYRSNRLSATLFVFFGVNVFLAFIYLCLIIGLKLNNEIDYLSFIYLLVMGVLCLVAAIHVIIVRRKKAELYQNQLKEVSAQICDIYMNSPYRAIGIEYTWPGVLKELKAIAGSGRAMTISSVLVEYETDKRRQIELQRIQQQMRSMRGAAIGCTAVTAATLGTIGIVNGVRKLL